MIYCEFGNRLDYSRAMLLEAAFAKGAVKAKTKAADVVEKQDPDKQELDETGFCLGNAGNLRQMLCLDRVSATEWVLYTLDRTCQPCHD